VHALSLLKKINNEQQRKGGKINNEQQTSSEKIVHRSCISLSTATTLAISLLWLWVTPISGNISQNSAIDCISGYRAPFHIILLLMRS
jgi:hypothetical protein